MKKFKFLEHTADVKFQAFGKNPEELFKNSALAMFSVMHDGKVKEKMNFKIKVKGKDLESLMYNFLEELIFLFDSKNFFLSKIKKINLNEKKFVINAWVSGDKTKNYEIALQVKAVTYNEMFVKNLKGKHWISQVVLDV